MLAYDQQIAIDRFAEGFDIEMGRVIRLPMSTTQKLASAMEFDHVIEVLPGGSWREPEGVYAPEITLFCTEDGDVLDRHVADMLAMLAYGRESWSLLTGHTSREGGGPIMDPKDLIGDDLAAAILARPGFYAAAVIDGLREGEEHMNDDEDVMVGWGVAYRALPVPVVRNEGGEPGTVAPVIGRSPGVASAEALTGEQPDGEPGACGIGAPVPAAGDPGEPEAAGPGPGIQITASAGGETIGGVYCPPDGAPGVREVRVSYSTDKGNSWQHLVTARHADLPSTPYWTVAESAFPSVPAKTTHYIATTWLDCLSSVAEALSAAFDDQTRPLGAALTKALEEYAAQQPGALCVPRGGEQA